MKEGEGNEREKVGKRTYKGKVGGLRGREFFFTQSLPLIVWHSKQKEQQVMNEKWDIDSGTERMEVTSGAREQGGIEGEDEAGHQDKWQGALERV